MRRVAFLLTSILAPIIPALAADLKPDATTDIPDGAKRPVVVQLEKSQIAEYKSQIPKAELPDGMELTIAAAAPLVTHPIMGCLDDRGRLFLGDCTGVNWNKAQLEKNPPNRVLMLEDTDKDGVFDKSTIFADKMTFPQGACWLDGSLYVCSPPGLWKLTDKDGDGVAEEREMIVGGFEYTGNAADVHGPFLHPNGRLYWCHGRKGHKVVQQDGTLVHEGLASGIWSCKPDGSDIQWHSLASGDNPVEVDFTPDGDIIGTQNLYYSQPRGDTIVHWLYGGVYERADQMKAIAGLPRTLETMPVMHDFGHVAVSGACFARSGVLFGKEADKSVRAPLHYLVTHFNTQRVVRMELTPDGATYKATEHEFLKLSESPDVHFTDVMEDADGSVLVVDTGGWFRIGCPASLMAKPDIAGAVYRVKKKPSGPYWGVQTGGSGWIVGKPTWLLHDEKEIVGRLESRHPQGQLYACEAVSKLKLSSPAIHGALLELMAKPLDPALEHAVMFAALSSGTIQPDDVQHAKNLGMVRRLLAILGEMRGDEGFTRTVTGLAAKHVDSGHDDLARVALRVVTRSPDACKSVAPILYSWLEDAEVSPYHLSAVQRFTSATFTTPEAQNLITKMLGHRSREVRNAAIDVIADGKSSTTNDAWLPPLEMILAEASPGDLPLLLSAIKKLKTDRFNFKLQAIADDAKQPLPLRLKALDAMQGGKMTPATFSMLAQILGVTPDSVAPSSSLALQSRDQAAGSNGGQPGSGEPGYNNASAAARIQAAGMLSSASLDAKQTTALAPAFASLGPVELKELMPVIKKNKDAAMLHTLATELAKNPSLPALQESAYRTAFADKPTELFENIVLPALRKANEFIESKKRLLPALAESAAAKGRVEEGRKHFEAGKGTCIACHKIGDAGRPIGPDLSKIGAIRTERDLMESIIFPSNTLSRDYETHIIETSDGQACMGVIKSHTAEGLLVVDMAGQEKNVPHASIVADTTLTTSLMPMGLDATMSEQELCDLVAWLRSLR